MTKSRLVGILAALLFAAGAQAQEDVVALHIAASEGNVAEVAALLAKGVPVDAKNRGFTALHVAAGKGHVAVVEALLAKGADPAATTTQGVAAIHLAAQFGHAPVVELLLAKGVSVDAPTADGRPP